MRVLTIEDTLRVTEAGFVQLANQELVSRPGVDIYVENGDNKNAWRWATQEGASKSLHRHAIHMMSDVLTWRNSGRGRVHEKYFLQPGKYCGLIFLFDTITGEPLAIIHDGYLQASGWAVLLR
jgi:hypothetical protein